MEYRIELLGGVSIHTSQGTADLSGILARMLLGLATAGGTITTEALIDCVWPEVPASGRNALHRHMNRLRRQFARLGVDQPIETIGRTGYRLDLERGVVDALVLEELVRSGRPLEQGPTELRFWLDPWPHVECPRLEPLRAHVLGLCEAARQIDAVAS